MSFNRLNKKQKQILNLLLLQEVDEEHAVINKIILNKRNEAHEVFLAKKTEVALNTLIKKHLWRDESKFREFFRLNWDQFTYISNIIDNDIKSSPISIV